MRVGGGRKGEKGWGKQGEKEKQMHEDDSRKHPAKRNKYLLERITWENRRTKFEKD